MNTNRLRPAVFVLGLVLVVGCTGGGGSNTDEGKSTRFDVPTVAAHDHREEPADGVDHVLEGVLVVEARSAEEVAGIVEGEVQPFSRQSDFEPLEPDESGLIEKLNEELAVVRFEGRTTDEALALVIDAGVDPAVVAPFYRLGLSGHWSAFPGTAPVGVPVDQWSPARGARVEGGELVVGIVDSGVLVDSPNADNIDDPWAIDTNYEACDNVSHGEAVASIIVQANPKATVVSANAFPKGEPCWTSTEPALIAAVNRLVGNYPVGSLNLSLGTVVHEVDGVSFPPKALGRILELVADQGIRVYAAAGNLDGADPVYPAAFDNVVGVYAGGPTGTDQAAALEAVRWTSTGTPTGVASLVSGSSLNPGCALVMQGIAASGGTLDTGRVLVWSGSSFASPLAAAVAPDLSYADLDQAMHNLDGHQFPTAPGDCQGPKS